MDLMTFYGVIIVFIFLFGTYNVPLLFQETFSHAVVSNINLMINQPSKQ